MWSSQSGCWNNDTMWDDELFNTRTLSRSLHESFFTKKICTKYHYKINLSTVPLSFLLSVVGWAFCIQSVLKYEQCRTSRWVYTTQRLTWLHCLDVMSPTPSAAPPTKERNTTIHTPLINPRVFDRKDTRLLASLPLTSMWFPFNTKMVRDIFKEHHIHLNKKHVVFSLVYNVQELKWIYVTLESLSYW